MSYDFIPCHWQFQMGGISEHFIWQADLVEHFIWKLDLILWLFQMGSHWRHRLGNSWSAVTGSFTWGVYLNLNTSSENINSYLMSVCTSSCSLHLTTTRGVCLTAYLYTSSANVNSFQVWVLLHRGLFFERPIILYICLKIIIILHQCFSL